MTEKRKGRQEPTVGFTLPYTNTRGQDAVDIYNKTNRQAMQWQEGLLYDMMAIDEENKWIHSRFGYSVPRQNGKNEVIAIREMWGLFNGERMLHTAHLTMTSRSAWERLVLLVEQYGIQEKKGEVKVGYKSGKSRGQEWIEFPEELGGGKISFRTRSSTGGLGETFDLLVIDEAQEYKEDHESALKYTIVSSDNPQTVFLGTPPTPYSSGTIFPALRKSILTGEKKHAGWAEWSVEEQTDPNDIDAWYETNPSLGTKISERAIEEEIGTNEVDFNIQRLGLWIKYNQKSAISKNEWDRLCVKNIPQFTGLLAVGIKFGKDSGNVALSVAVKTQTEAVFVECIGCKPQREGIGWIVNFLSRIKGKYIKIVCDGASGQELLKKTLKENNIEGLILPTVKEIIEANSLFEQKVFNGGLVHMDQPSVQYIVTNCEKRAIGSSGGFGYKSQKATAEVSIMDSIILALWCVIEYKDYGTVQTRQKVSY